jgi:hypothetical protein
MTIATSVRIMLLASVNGAATRAARGRIMKIAVDRNDYGARVQRGRHNGEKMAIATSANETARMTDGTTRAA